MEQILVRENYDKTYLLLQTTSEENDLVLEF